MLDMKMVIKESAKTIKGLVEGWNFFLRNEIVVGIPEETNVTREEGVSNAELLYLHENGVPSHNIPPRPVLRPAIAADETREKIQKLMKDAAVEALVHGNQEQARKDFEKAGMVGRDACKNWIQSGDKLAPNAPSTIARKSKKGKKNGVVKPLIDTASMLNSITYAVRRK